MEHPAQTQMASKLTHVATGAVSRCSFADRVHTNIFGLDAQSTNIVCVLHQSAVQNCAEGIALAVSVKQRTGISSKECDEKATK